MLTCSNCGKPAPVLSHLYDICAPGICEECVIVLPRFAAFNRFEIQMTITQAQSANHPGRCDEEVNALLEVPTIRQQLDKIWSAKIAKELRDYGAWSDEELKDEASNRQRIIWIAAGNICEEEGK